MSITASLNSATERILIPLFTDGETMDACVFMACPRFPVRRRQRFDRTPPNASVEAMLLLKGLRACASSFSLMFTELSDQGLMICSRPSALEGPISAPHIAQANFLLLTLGMFSPLTAVDIEVTDS